MISYIVIMIYYLTFKKITPRIDNHITNVWWIHKHQSTITFLDPVGE